MSIFIILSLICYADINSYEANLDVAWRYLFVT